MKPLLVALLFSLVHIASSAQESEFKFRNDNRPAFTKSVIDGADVPPDDYKKPEGFIY
jgi:hypothetical protein